MKLNKNTLLLSVLATMLPLSVYANEHHHATHASVTDKVIAEQRSALEKNTKDIGFGPQSPRDIDAKSGINTIAFNPAPDYKEMNLCNIHFHKNAEHKGGEFTLYAGNGDGHGFQSGFKYAGELSHAESTPTAHEA